MSQAKTKNQYMEELINRNYINFAVETLKALPLDYEKERQNYTRGEKIYVEETKDKEAVYYILKDIVVYHATENIVINNHKIYIDKGAIFCYDILPLTLHYSTYRIRFGIPKTLIKECSQELYEPGKLVLSEWTYNNFYFKSILRILENHGKMLIGLMNCDPNAPMLKYSSYNKLISILRIERNMNEVKN